MFARTASYPLQVAEGDDQGGQHEEEPGNQHTDDHNGAETAAQQLQGHLVKNKQTELRAAQCYLVSGKTDDTGEVQCNI